jgi:hypothetical protein
MSPSGRRTGPLAGAALRILRIAVVPAAAVALAAVYAYALFPARSAAGTHITFAPDVVAVLKAFGAGLGATFFVVDSFRRLEGRALSPRTRRIAFAAMTVFGIVGYMNFGDIGYVRVYHRWEFFHYYMGSKYSDELGYKRIYAATAIAESELGPTSAAEVRKRSIRNLNTDTVEPASVALDDPAPYKDRFTPERWASFKRDVRWFRAQCSADWWRDMQKDHGYNPSPVWTMLGHAVGSVAPASDTFLRFLSAIDLVLFGVLFGAVAVAFGGEVAAVVVLYWGTQWPADFVFTWGGFLRQDWICAVVLAACFAKAGRWRWSGALVAYAALVRVFPVLLAGGVFMAAAWHWCRHSELRPDHRAFFRGFFESVAALVVLASLAVGPRSFVAFQQHIRAQSQTPATNLMGLKTALIFDFAERVDATKDDKSADPFHAWKAAREIRSRARAPLFYLLALTGCTLVGWSVRRPREIWVTMAQSAVLFPLLLESTNYYYSLFLLVPLLCSLGPRFAIVALTGAALSAAGIVWARTSGAFDVRCVVQSVIFLAMGLTAAILGGRTVAVQALPAVAPWPVAGRGETGAERMAAAA